jgi:hypothetical protein
MASVSHVVSSVTGGITQNPPEAADAGRVKDSLNMVPVPKSGLARRSGTDHLVGVNADNALETALLPVDFGGEDRYIAAVSHDQVKVFRRNGEEVVVKGVTRDAAGAITGGTDPDFSYLNLRAPNELPLPETFEVGSGKWVISFNAVATSIGIGPDSPLGWPANSAFAAQDAYSGISVTAGIGNYGRWRHTGVSGHLWTKKWGYYLNINLDVPGAGTLVLPDKFSLILRDPSDATDRTVTWDLTGGASAVPTVDSNSEDFIVFSERVGTGNEYRIGFVFDPDRASAPSGTSSVIYPYMEILDNPSGSDLAGLYVWGGLLVPDPPVDKMPPYGLPPEALRHITAGATTFVANPAVATRAGSGDSKTFAEVYPDVDFTNIPGPSTTSHPVASAGYVFVKQGLAAGTADTLSMTIGVVVEDTVGAGGQKTITSALTGQKATSAAASAHVTALNGHGSNQNAAGTQTILKASSLGSVVLIQTADASPTEKWEIVSINVFDDLGDTIQSAYTDQVDDISDLPKLGPAHHGHVVKLVETADKDKDDFKIPQVILRFVGDDPTDGVFGFGRWVEGTDFGVRTELDADTLPHTLVRRRDNSVGTVTGNAFDPYFEWAPHAWSDRVVGGDVANPLPSFITPEADEGIVDRYVDAIGFYGNRLILGSGLSLAFSEVALYGNFWRSTLRALPDSDRIDVVLSVPDVARIRDIGVAAGRVFVRTNRALQVITTAGALSPRTIGVETAYGGGSDPMAQSKAASGGIFVPGDGSDSGGVVYVYPAGNSENLAFDSIELTEDVPYLLDKEIHTLVWASALSSLFVHSREDPSKLYGFRFSSQTRQLAWYPLDFGGNVHSFCVLAGEMYVLVERPDGTTLERLSLAEIHRDTAQDWKVRLDRRLSEQDLQTAMTYSSPNTTITLPYTITTGATVVVTPRDGTDYGVKETVVSATGTSVVVEGDVTAESLLIGETFESYFEPLHPVLRDIGGAGLPVPRALSTVFTRECAIAFAETGHAEIAVTNPDAQERTTSFDGESSTLVENLSRPLRSVVTSSEKDALVRVRTSEQKPMTVVGLEWLLEVNDRAQRIVS